MKITLLFLCLWALSATGQLRDTAKLDSLKLEPNRIIAIGPFKFFDWGKPFNKDFALFDAMAYLQARIDSLQHPLDSDFRSDDFPAIDTGCPPNTPCPPVFPPGLHIHRIARDTAVFFLSNLHGSPNSHPENPFPRILIRIIEYGKSARYLKKMKHGWAQLPGYYKVWNN